MTDELPGEPTRRIERLIDVLSLLAMHEYEPALNHIEVGESEDRLAFLEKGLALFIEEIIATHEENRVHVAALEDKLEIIERQQLAIRELSTPIIELWDDILTLPLIGVVDTQRSLEMTERLLQRISDSQARCVIIDVTGIDVIDTMTANHFMQMIHAARLLGAYCVITGMSPDMAQTIVSIGIGVDFGSIQTLRSLKHGLEHCMAYLQHDRGEPGS